jgi:hypothetical protein
MYLGSIISVLDCIRWSSDVCVLICLRVYESCKLEFVEWVLIIYCQLFCHKYCGGCCWRTFILIVENGLRGYIALDILMLKFLIWKIKASIKLYSNEAFEILSYNNIWIIINIKWIYLMVHYKHAKLKHKKCRIIS